MKKLKVHQTLTANDESTRRAVRMERIKTMIHEQTRQTKDHKSKKIMHKIQKNKEANIELLHNFVEQKQQPSSIIRDAKYSAVPPPKENIKDRTCMGTTWLSKKQITDTESNKRRLSKFSDSLSCIACVAGIPPSEPRHDDELLLDNKVKEMLQKELEDSSMIMNTKKVAFLSDLVGDFDEHVRDDLLCNYGNVIEEAKGSNKTPPTKMNERYKGHMSRTTDPILTGMSRRMKTNFIALLETMDEDAGLRLGLRRDSFGEEGVEERTEEGRYEV